MPLCFVGVCFLVVFTLGNVIDEPEHEKDEEKEHPLGEEADGGVVGEFGFHRAVIRFRLLFPPAWKP